MIAKDGLNFCSFLLGFSDVGDIGFSLILILVVSIGHGHNLKSHFFAVGWNLPTESTVPSELLTKASKGMIRVTAKGIAFYLNNQTGNTSFL